jgi:hypothetical protein
MVMLKNANDELDNEIKRLMNNESDPLSVLVKAVQ